MFPLSTIGAADGALACEFTTVKWTGTQANGAQNNVFIIYSSLVFGGK
jgi:hypothetical protein